MQHINRRIMFVFKVQTVSKRQVRPGKVYVWETLEFMKLTLFNRLYTLNTVCSLLDDPQLFFLFNDSCS